jgi:hypothetical protein
VNRHHRVLARNEAQQMVTDLGDAIEKVIMMTADADDTTKVMALDTLSLLQTKRNILQGELAQAADEATP